MDGGRGEIRARLRAATPLVLDGATGTELERRGVHTRLPLWSSHALIEAPDAVQRVHADYVEAGVGAITANTFRTQRRTLERAGLGPRAGALTALAVERARAAAARSRRGPVLVLGSQPPLEDCYRPDLVPGREALEREHAEHAEHLAAAGVDAVLVETMNTVREGVAAAAAVRAAGLPLLLSWICWDGARLLSGEPLAAALDAGSAASPDAMLVNCLPPSNVAACTEVLSALPGAWGVYANLGEPAAETGFARSEDCTPTEFADLAAGWVAAGARIVGGCCGTTPAHLRAVVSRVCNSTPGPAASRVG